MKYPAEGGREEHMQRPWGEASQDQQTDGEFFLCCPSGESTGARGRSGEISLVQPHSGSGPPPLLCSTSSLPSWLLAHQLRSRAAVEFSSKPSPSSSQCWVTLPRPKGERQVVKFPACQVLLLPASVPSQVTLLASCPGSCYLKRWTQRTTCPFSGCNPGPTLQLFPVSAQRGESPFSFPWSPLCSPLMAPPSPSTPPPQRDTRPAPPQLRPSLAGK